MSMRSIFYAIIVLFVFFLSVLFYYFFILSHLADSKIYFTLPPPSNNGAAATSGPQSVENPPPSPIDVHSLPVGGCVLQKGFCEEVLPNNKKRTKSMVGYLTADADKDSSSEYYTVLSVLPEGENRPSFQVYRITISPQISIASTVYLPSASSLYNLTFSKETGEIVVDLLDTPSAKPEEERLITAYLKVDQDGKLVISRLTR